MQHKPTHDLLQRAYAKCLLGKLCQESIKTLLGQHVLWMSSVSLGTQQKHATIMVSCMVADL